MDIDPDDDSTFVIYLRTKTETLVTVDNRAALDQNADDGIIFEEFVRKVREYFSVAPCGFPQMEDIYVGFWGQWSLTIPASFFALVAEIGVPVILDIDE